MKRSRLSYGTILATTASLLLLNIIFVLIFRKNISISTYSLPPIALGVLVLINGVLACILKHKGNFLVIRKHRGMLFYLKDRTLTDSYEKEFRMMLLIYCAAIPFYIPIICFASNWADTLWTLLVFIVPQGIFIAHEIRKTIQDVKIQKEREKERIEQERREELGYLK